MLNIDISSLPINPLFMLAAADKTFNDIVVLLVMAVIFGLIALYLRLPLIIGFIIVGIAAGPSLFEWQLAFEEIELLAELGMSLLLFVVGLKLDVRHLKSIGKAILVAGIIQMAVSIGLGYPLTLLIGLSGVDAAYVAVSLGFCSTIIIVKLLSDKGEADSLHGRIGVGILVLDDIVVVLVMIIITSFAGNKNANLFHEIAIVFAKGIGLVALTIFFMNYILPKLFSKFAESAELLVLASITCAFSFAVFSGYMGFSKEVGAFLAGVALASTDYREVIGSRLVALRDFLLLFFFVDLGMKLDTHSLGSQAWGAIPLALFVLIFKPTIVAIILNMLGYRKRTSFLAGMLVSQTSEFSLILVALGLRLNHINEHIVSLVTLTAIITIGLSSYMIFYANEIYQFLSPYFRNFGNRNTHMDEEMDAVLSSRKKNDIIIFGLGTYGSGIATSLMQRGYSVLAVDFDPQVVKNWNAKGGTALFGDAEDQEFPSTLPLSNTKWVVSAINNRSINVLLVKALENYNYEGNIAVTSKDDHEADDLKALGADIIFFPHEDASIEAANRWVEADNHVRRLKMDKKIKALTDHYIVCGFGRMGQQIGKDFEHNNIPYVVIESNKEQIPILRSQDVPYIKGNASDDDVLLKAGIERAKGLIAVNATDEENVFIVLTARGLSSDLYIVARSILQENEDKLKRAGANRVMSPYILGGNRMALAVLHPEAIELFGLQLNGAQIQIEIANIQLPEESCVLSKTIADSGLHKIAGIALVALRHSDGEITVNPTLDTQLKCGDEVIITGTVSQIERVKKLIDEQS